LTIIRFPSEEEQRRALYGQQGKALGHALSTKVHGSTLAPLAMASCCHSKADWPSSSNPTSEEEQTGTVALWAVWQAAWSGKLLLTALPVGHQQTKSKEGSLW
jgi:hypothetical protein